LAAGEAASGQRRAYITSVTPNGETVLQLNSVGPWKIIYVNAADDPRYRATTNPADGFTAL